MMEKWRSGDGGTNDDNRVLRLGHQYYSSVVFGWAS
jgi:hypothetical protein